ncbi:hypothetical protein [Catenulispora rubra]|uniref:hypothetical protein n=1 Tax=Catenulispora rubra TaxID=280293 RepID=UPI001892157C|nr:hypothetical protein [Catenulispora rubra]
MRPADLAVGLCASHGRRRASGEPGRDAPLRDHLPRAGKVCDLAGCGRAVAKGGLCGTHYRRRRVGQADWDCPINEQSRNKPRP